ncbi:hypothetical protein [Staphylococcus phage vB_SauM-V1SA09]|nr:hypothetical protein [Staphylococcus phage vB_ScaM-V1SC01]WOZ17348.1 hypothetical protein [Staphylococcus phage vB_SauM-V1SA09]
MHSNSVYKISKYNVYHKPSNKIIKGDIDIRELVHLLFTMYEKNIIKVYPMDYGLSLLTINVQGLIKDVEAEGNIIIDRLISS